MMLKSFDDFEFSKVRILVKKNFEDIRYEIFFFFNFIMQHNMTQLLNESKNFRNVF